MDIFLGCDSKFLPYTCTVIASISETAFSSACYNISILHDGIEDRLQAIVNSWADKKLKTEIKFIDVTRYVDSIGKEKFKLGGPYSIATYYRLFAPVIFNEVEKILYLDSDLLFFDDVAKLFDIDIGDSLFGACLDFEIQRHLDEGTPQRAANNCRDVLNISARDGYYNAGVMLMNLRKFREENIFDKSIEALHSLKKLELFDQDLLNYTCKGQIFTIPNEWNCQDMPLDLAGDNPMSRHADPELVKKCLVIEQNIKVLHTKPWGQIYCGDYEKEFWYFAGKTPFYAEILKDYYGNLDAWPLLKRYGRSVFDYYRCSLLKYFGNDARKSKYDIKAFQYDRTCQCIRKRLKSKSSLRRKIEALDHA